MPDPLTGLDRIPESFREPVRAYAGLVRDVARDNARSLTLFGPIATGVFDPRRHLIRSVLVVGRVDLSALRRIAQQGPRLGKHRISAPLVMTPDYIRASLDTFPLELLDIQQAHLTLFGEDAFAGLSFDEGHVRLQCERELKVILIGLRQGLLAAAGREKVIGELEAGATAALMRTLRGMLWLKGQREATPAHEVVVQIEKLTNREVVGLRTALDTSAQHGWQQFEALYRDVESLGEAVDAW